MFVISRKNFFLLALFCLLFIGCPVNGGGDELETVLGSWSAGGYETAGVALLSSGSTEFFAGSLCIGTDRRQGVLSFDFKVSSSIWQGPFQDYGAELVIDYYDVGSGVLEVALGDEVDLRLGNLLGKIQKSNSYQWKQMKLPLSSSLVKDQDLVIVVNNCDPDSEAYIRKLSIVPREVRQKILADFEQPITIDVRPGTDSYGSFQRTNAEKKNGEYSGQLNFDFTRSGTVHANRYVEYIINPRLGELRQGDKIGMWVKAKGDPYRVIIRIIDRNGEVFQSPPLLEGSPDADWKYVTTIPADNWGHWGGDNNGRIDYPAQILSIVVDKSPKNASYQTKGSFYIDDLSVIYE